MFTLMFFAMVWIVLVITTGVVAERKGRNVAGWVALSVFVPIVILILLATRSLEPRTRSMVEANVALETKLCPECAAPVRLTATSCGQCGHNFSAAYSKPC